MHRALGPFVYGADGTGLPHAGDSSQQLDREDRSLFDKWQFVHIIVFVSWAVFATITVDNATIFRPVGNNTANIGTIDGARLALTRPEGPTLGVHSI